MNTFWGVNATCPQIFNSLSKLVLLFLGLSTFSCEKAFCYSDFIKVFRFQQKTFLVHYSTDFQDIFRKGWTIYDVCTLLKFLDNPLSVASKNLLSDFFGPICARNSSEPVEDIYLIFSGLIEEGLNLNKISFSFLMSSN